MLSLSLYRFKKSPITTLKGSVEDTFAATPVSRREAVVLDDTSAGIAEFVSFSFCSSDQ